MQEVHIMVSEKGSAGKTSQALSLALYFMSKSFNTCIIDLNGGNPDMEDVFANFPSKVDIISPEGDGSLWEGLYLRRTLAVAGKMTGKTFTFITPYYQLETTDEMLRFVDCICKNENVTKVVVDTGRNLHEFMVGGNSTKLLEYTPTFWFTWLWALPGSRNKLQRVEKAVKFFKETLYDWSDVNLINVFNVYRIKEKVKRLKKVVQKFDKRMKSGVEKASPLSFDRIMKCVKIVAKALGINDPSRDEIRYREIPGLWAETFERMLQAMGKDGLPSNICILPNVARMTMFIDQIIMARPTRVATIRKMLGRFYDNVRHFAEIHAKSLSIDRFTSNTEPKSLREHMEAEIESVKKIVREPGDIEEEMEEVDEILDDLEEGLEDVPDGVKDPVEYVELKKKMDETLADLVAGNEEKRANREKFVEEPTTSKDAMI